LLERVAALIERDHDELVELTIRETGGTRRTCRNIQVPQAAVRFRRYARGAMESTVTPLPPSIAEASALGPASVTNALAQRLPVGVVSAITSYNFPLVNMAGKIGPALAAGNTVVVKPAPQDPLGVLRLVDLCQEAGFPAGVVNAVTTTNLAPAEVLTTHADVDMVSFTGSTVVGQAIAEAGGRTMKRLLLELGGKAPASSSTTPTLVRPPAASLRCGVPLRPDLHGPDPSSRSPRHPRPVGREPVGGPGLPHRR